jgi:RimJ/RimL family protein N-acetyltransferase
MPHSTEQAKHATLIIEKARNEQVFRQQSVKMIFIKANLQHQDIIFKWLDKPHVKEFWDNSHGHRDDILKFLNGRTEKSGYFGGIFTYWIGLLDNVPYALLMTSEALDTQADLPPLWLQHLSQTGRTYTIDFCIGNEKYLGTGLAAPTLEAFTQFFQNNIDRSASTFFIDPDEHNPRAKHVYAKAGFKSVGEFFMEKGVFQGQKTYLMVKCC